MNNLRHSAVIETHPDVMMDDCHIDLIKSLILASKPDSILEIGFGSGAVTMSILDAIRLNEKGSLAIVDNFGDWEGFKEPQGFHFLMGAVSRFIKSSEESFVKTCIERFDFVISDADHAHSGEWFLETLGLVSEGGTLIYHDADNPHCPSVRSVIPKARDLGLDLMLFNKNSLPNERCDRGLLVIKKS